MMNESLKFGCGRLIAGFMLFILPLSTASGQDDSDRTLFLSQRFQSYCRSVPWEEIYIHTDRDEYIAGEDLWFSAYLIDRQQFNPSLHSRIIYFELLNPVNNPVIQVKILLKEGQGQGHIKLPDSLVSGTYTIRACTKWMQNFFPGNCFSRDINIYSSLPSRKFYRKVPIEEKQTHIDYGLLSRGLKMTASRKTNGDAEISVEATDDTLRTRGDQLYIFIQSHGNIIFTSAIKLQRGSTRITVPGKSFSHGISQVTLFDAVCNPLCDRFIYTPPDEVRQPATLRTEDISKTREKITLEFLPDEALTGSHNSAFSISVSPKTSISSFPGISEYLLFGTEFGSLPVIQLKGRKMDDLKAEEMESLLNTLKSNWIDWEKILPSQNIRFKFQAEATEISIPGKVIDSNFRPALKDEILTMSIPGKIPRFQYAVTDIEGNFSFVLPVDEEERDLVIQTDNISAGYKILLQSPYSGQMPVTTLIIDTTTSEPTYIKKWRHNSQISRLYETIFTGEDVKPDTSHSVFKRFYGKPDFSLVLDDYVRLPLMEEVFFELIPRVKMKSTARDCEIIILNPAGNKMFEDPPVLMIDGVIIKNASTIKEIDPGNVEKIDVVWKPYVVDAYSFPGIVNIITKEADFSYGVLLPGSLRMSYKLTESVATFSSPEYSVPGKKQSRIPDFRNTMYWNPVVRPDKDGEVKIEFWTSDYAADYVVNIQGLTGVGEAVSLSKVIKVRRSIVR